MGDELRKFWGRWNVQEPNGKKRQQKRQLQKSLTIRGVNQKIPTKGGSLKKYWDRIKQYKQNRSFHHPHKKERKFWQQAGRQGIKKISYWRRKKQNKTWCKIRRREKTKRKYCRDNIKEELEEFEGSPEAKIQLEWPGGTLKKIQNHKMPGHDGIHGFWF